MAARRVRAVPAATDPAQVAALRAAVRLAISGEGPPLAPHPPDRVPAQSPADEPLGAGEDDTDDPTALIVATSGSTGPPKPALLPASALLASASATHDRLGGPGRWLLAVPAHTVAGLMVLVRCLVAGREPAVCPLGAGFRPAGFVTATRQMPTGRRYTALVATQVHRLLSAGGEATAALRSFDAVLLGGGPVPAGLREAAAAADVRLVATYGASETAGGCVYDGVPLDGVIVDADEEGRLRVSGPVVALGYRGMPGHPSFDTVDGRRRFRTDDMGTVTGEGDAARVSVLGRVDDVVVVGGFKVSAGLVADALRALPGVSAAGVVGVPDEQWGRRLVAAVCAADGVDGQHLRAAVARRLGRWAAPEIHLVERVPETAPGKLDRRAIAALAGGAGSIGGGSPGTPG